LLISPNNFIARKKIIKFFMKKNQLEFLRSACKTILFGEIPKFVHRNTVVGASERTCKINTSGRGESTEAEVSLASSPLPVFASRHSTTAAGAATARLGARPLALGFLRAQPASS
jgi:hypothetical protein